MRAGSRTAVAASSGLLAAVGLTILGPAGCSAHKDLQPDDHPLATTIPSGTPSTAVTPPSCVVVYAVEVPGVEGG